MGKEVANNDDVSDVDDVDLECCWRSPDRAFDCRDCETFVEMIMRRLTRTVACG